MHNSLMHDEQREEQLVITSVNRGENVPGGGACHKPLLALADGGGLRDLHLTIRTIWISPCFPCTHATEATVGTC
jgi:hypothetical protein